MKTLITNGTIINEGERFIGTIAIDGEKIVHIIKGENARIENEFSNARQIDARGQWLIPGVIDDQVHFREPGLTHKGEIATESRSAVAGGVTSYMEMPNTNPQTTTQQALKDKFELAAEKSLANYSFYMGATNDNLAELLKTDPKHVCGIKVFMGASTGNMLVDNSETLAGIFSEAPCLIATHCEDEQTIKNNLALYQEKFGDNILPKHHPLIRSEEACYLSSVKAAELATKYGTQLHILHLSTARELSLLTSGNVRDKKITGEVCVHHLWFNDEHYESLGHRIKWNPSVKTKADQDALLAGVLSNKLDVIATDHAPHLLEEKLNQYTKSASGGPMVQHSLVTMLEMAKQGKIRVETVVHKMCHAPADLYRVKQRGYLRPGYFADIAIVDPSNPWTVSSNNILAKCAWSPLEGQLFNAKVTHTFVNGNLVYQHGKLDEQFRGKALEFER